MIGDKTFTLEWIESIAKQYRNADKILVEKAIRALTLLSELRAEGLEFVFKGGTALMLMLGAPKRLSIDIDIILPDKTIDLNKVFADMIKKGRFHRFQEQERFVSSEIQKAHFKFFYTPCHRTHSTEEYILLDILFEDIPYQKITEIPIDFPFLSTSGDPGKVKVPTFENILGDKLTAFAPNTTGIPYYRNNTSMSMEIIKQLFDIGNLFGAISDIAEIEKTFCRIAEIELEYRNLSHFKPADVLNDIIQTALGISSRGAVGIVKFDEIQKGIERIKQFIISESFSIDNAIVAASKAAYLAALVKSGNKNADLFSVYTDIQTLSITNTDYNKLNKLKKINREAFWYWYQTVLLLSDSASNGQA